MAVLNGGYLVQLLFISLLDLVKKGTREMKLDKKNISQDSLENLLIVLMNCKDEDGLLLNINPDNAFQDWLIEMYPESMRNHWFNMHSYVKAQEK